VRLDLFERLSNNLSIKCSLTSIALRMDELWPSQWSTTGCRRTESSTLMDLYFETHLYLHSNNDMYMWNQVNCTQNYYANVGTSAPYNQWSYLLVSYPHHLATYSWIKGTRERFLYVNSKQNKRTTESYKWNSFKKSLRLCNTRLSPMWNRCFYLVIIDQQIHLRSIFLCPWW
jgi:hypothetical protein